MTWGKLIVGGGGGGGGGADLADEGRDAESLKGGRPERMSTRLRL